MHSLLFLFLYAALFAADFDCIIVGSSPFSLFEALYQSHSGNHVLILEEGARCGGAWQGIDVCGVKNADLGCHLIGHETRLKTFLEEYTNCHIVSMDNPKNPFGEEKGSNGWYFARGSSELIDNLLHLIDATDIVLLTHTRAECAHIDSLQKIVTVETQERSYTTNKLIVTPLISLNLQPMNAVQNYSKSQHYHLYLLIQDPTPPRFSYHNGVMNGASRMMNLTHFVDLVGTGRQLIVIQTQNEQCLARGETFLEGLKKNNLVDPSAYILEMDHCIYEAGAFHQGNIEKMGAQDMIEILQTGHILNLANYIPKWEMALKPKLTPD